MSATRITADERKARKAAYRRRHRAENYEAIRAKERAESDASKERAAKWRAENAEKSKAYFKARYEQQKEVGARATPEAKAKAAAYYAANRARLLEQHSAYKKVNPHLVRNMARTRRAKIAGTGGVLSADIEQRLLGLQRGKCANCRKKLKRHHVDHIVPIAKGGANVDCNAQLLCPTCNLKKHAKDPVAFAQEQGRLL